MPRVLLLALPFVIVPLAVVLALRPAAAKDAEPAAKGVAALSWLQGSWRTADGDSTWETVYTSADGGEVVSATKEIAGGKVAAYDYERFFEKDGKVVLNPYPHGARCKHDFPLESLDASAKRAVFVNTANDFPSRFTYHRAADDRLVITLEGKQGGNPTKFVLDFKKR